MNNKLSTKIILIILFIIPLICLCKLPNLDSKEEFKEIPYPPVIQSVEPNLIAYPFEEPLVITFTNTKNARDYEIILAGQKLFGVFDPDPVSSPEGTTIKFTVILNSEDKNYNKANDFVRNLGASYYPYTLYVNSENRFQKSPSLTAEIYTCIFDTPIITGTKGACPETPCAGSSMFGMPSIIFEYDSFAQYYEFELFQAWKNKDTNETYFNLKEANAISKSIRENLKDPTSKPVKKPEYPMIGYGRITSNDLAIPTTDLYNFKDPVYPGEYYIRIRAFNKLCNSDWSEAYKISYYTHWSHESKSLLRWQDEEVLNTFKYCYHMQTSMIEDVAIDLNNDIIYFANNGGKIHSLNTNNTYCDANIIDSALGRYNVQAFNYDAIRVNVFGYKELKQDPFGNNVDGIAVDEMGNIYVSSDQTGFIYKYGPKYNFIKKFGHGTSTPHDPEKDSLFWDITYYDGKIYALDANDYDDNTPQPRYIYVFDSETGDELSKFEAARKISKKGQSELWGITVDKCNKYLLVTNNDESSKKVIILDLEGNVVGSFGGPSVFGDPTGIDIDCEGIIYINDGSFYGNPPYAIHAYYRKNNAYVPFNRKDTLVTIGTGLIRTGRGISIDKNHNIFAANSDSVDIFKPIY